jgi:hypothetical protein
MRIKLILLVLAISTLFASGVAVARSWRVELDGSGDFTDIQPAVEASAAGDTILIGPGRFDTFHPCVAPAWTEQTVVWVTREYLTFIGSGQGVTIIGPATYYGPYGRSPKGICSIDGYSGTVRDLTIENIDTGLYWWRGSLTMEDCTIKGDNDQSFGAMGLWPYGATIRRCTIDTHFAGDACVIGMGSRDILFEHCYFLGYGYGVTVTDSSQNVRFEGCRFSNSLGAAIHCNYQSTVTVTDCLFEAMQTVAINVWNESHLTLERSTIDGASIGIGVSSGGVLIGTNVVIQGAWSEAIRACCNAFITMHNSHIFAGPGIAVRCESMWAHTQFPDLSGNYWGTTDADAIRATIWDANDTSDTNCLVGFEPFADGPVPTESTSWGDLKASFR